MHWVLQENLFREHEWGALMACLERHAIPYSVHKVVPFVGELVPAAEPRHDKVVCFGSYSMRHTAHANGWSPGVYDLYAQDFRVQREHWGAQRMLNGDSVVVAFKDARLDRPAFVRPVDDSKYFAGAVFEPDAFNTWVHQVAVLKEDFGNSLTGETLVQICAPKTIHAEYRYWIVDGAIVTRSLYRRGGKPFMTSDVDARCDAYVREIVAIWQPARAFVVDVCDTPDGLRIVEINTINAAGFYAGDVQALVLALEQLEG
ncbi:MAG TPA: ATP-grasp domain-containing protein [Tahibacter sp.]|nr:ATP-grasp domain-containing protein [Tahibacter sp.]